MRKKLYKKTKKKKKKVNPYEKLDDIIYYSYLDEKYIDFFTIMYLTNKDKTFLWKLLIKLEIPSIVYLNRHLYKFKDIISSVEIMELLDVDKMGF
jgi:hypothetical protein